MAIKTIIEPFRIKMVEPITMHTEAERIDYLKAAHYNPFQLSSDQVIIDLLTDSGTSAMSARQWAGMMEGDESYAGSQSWLKMEKAVKDLSGMEYILPTHQGRAAERIIYTLLGGAGKYFFSNTHFDTTRANIEFSGATAIDLPIEEGKNPQLIHPFKGNLDVAALEKHILDVDAQQVSAVILTVTNNSGGGQPVSMQNAREVAAVCAKYNIPFLLDMCRIAENAWFIRQREEGFADVSCYDIAREMMRLADGAVMSSKKDALVNMGGFLALKDPDLAEECKNLLIITEGFTTYGGLSGRDMEAIAIGLEEVFRHDYLEYRIKSTEYLGRKLTELGVPIMQPTGGHAVYVDARTFYDHIPVHEYPGQALVCDLYRVGGIRAVEVGSVMFGKYDEHGAFIPAPMDLVRLAIPRRVYTQSHMEYVAEVFAELVEQKQSSKGYRIIKEPKFLRHFTAWFEEIV
ncbi:MAG: tryptophanase [Flavobacteriales bacterium]|nr:tryptophanase [Bacteroidota bacterium]MCB9240409.1 tryptophanase [Flavobacteriales bacterium]